MTQIHQGLKYWGDTDAQLVLPYWLTLLAEAYGRAGQPEEGLDTLAKALVITEHTGEFWWMADIYWLKGELLLAQTTKTHTVQDVEACFRQAIDIARTQQAKSLELRAATSLARLWQQQGKRQDARKLLALLYGWFTEGLGTADLQEARALLDEMGG